MKAIYVIISRTHTKFGGIVRFFSGSRFNHAAIALDKEMRQWYSFARKKKSNLLSAKFVKENLARYVEFQGAVNCNIYKIPVSDEDYQKVQKRLRELSYDDTYLYNYISILTYPILGGVRCRKTFTCVEFVCWILNSVGISLSKEQNKMSPDELSEDLRKYLCYSGDLSHYVCSHRSVYHDRTYFERFALHDIAEGLKVLAMTRRRLS